MNSHILQKITVILIYKGASRAGVMTDAISSCVSLPLRKECTADQASQPTQWPTQMDGSGWRYVSSGRSR